MDSNRLGRIIRFLISGGAAVAVNVGTLFVLTHYGHLLYLFSAAIAFVVALLVSFSMQKFWTFADTRMHLMASQILKYGTIQGWDFVLNLAALYALVSWLHLWYVAAEVVIALLIAIQNYLLYRAFVFTDLEPMP